jgi:hypothetical protein
MAADLSRAEVWLLAAGRDLMGGMGVVIRIEEREVNVASGSSMTFGRAIGPLHIAAGDDRVSRQHGIIGCTDSGWYVHSTSPHYGFAVYDCDTPSRLHVPPGAGPLNVPFTKAIVSIEILGTRHHFQVVGPGVDNWASNWGPHIRRTEAPVVVRPVGETRYVWDEVSLRGRDGQVLQWYRALVAMCEPRLQNPPIERIPTDVEIAKRLNISPKTLEKHRDRLRDELGFNKYDEQMRLAAVVLALGQGLVTMHDLSVLDVTGSD